MKVILQKDKEPEREADLFAIGACLGLEIEGSMIRIALTPSQWKTLADSAKTRANAKFRHPDSSRTRAAKERARSRHDRTL